MCSGRGDVGQVCAPEGGHGTGDAGEGGGKVPALSQLQYGALAALGDARAVGGKGKKAVLRHQQCAVAAQIREGIPQLGRRADACVQNPHALRHDAGAGSVPHSVGNRRGAAAD